MIADKIDVYSVSYRGRMYIRFEDTEWFRVLEGGMIKLADDVTAEFERMFNER